MSNDFLPVHLIQTFVAFIEAANITEAADKLGISQPAVSVHLKKLEELLPHPVFFMQGKRKVLSAYGQALYDRLAPAFHQMQKSVQQVGFQFDPLEDLQLKIAGPPEALYRLPISPDFRGTIHLLEMTEKEALQSLSTKTIDLALCATKQRQFHSFEILRDEFHFTVHRSLFESETDLYNPDWFYLVPCIRTQDSSQPLESWLKTRKVDLGKIKKNLWVKSWQAAEHQVLQAKGFSVLPFQIKSNIEIHSFSLPAKINSTFMYYAHHSLGDKDQALLSHLFLSQ